MRSSVAAVTPTLLAALHRLGPRASRWSAPRPDLSPAAAYLWMLTGEEPTPQAQHGHRAAT